MTFTKTETAILGMLSDGQKHSKYELLDAMDDPLASVGNLKSHISRMRKKLRMIGENILCEYAQKGYYYRHVRLLAPHDGR